MSRLHEKIGNVRWMILGITAILLIGWWLIVEIVR